MMKAVFLLLGLGVLATVVLLATQDSTGSTFLENGVTAQRGDAARFPENTLAAIEGAIEVGADWVEVDIYRTLDGVLVASHDSTTGRVGDRSIRIKETTYEQLRSVDVASDFRSRNRFTESQCPRMSAPRLTDILDLVQSQHRTRVSIQPNGDFLPELWKLIRDRKAERWIGVNSTKAEVLSEARSAFPEAPLFWERRKESDLAADIKLATREAFGTLVLQRASVTEEAIDKVHRAGLLVGAWPIQDAAAMDRFLAMGVDRIFTHDPGLLLERIAKKKP